MDTLRPEDIDAMRSECEDTAETKETTNLVLSKHDFMTRMLKEPDGWQLLDLLENGEWRVAERLGLILGERTPRGIEFQVPRWRNLVAHLRIVNSV